MVQSKDNLKLLTLNVHGWQETDNALCLRQAAEAIRQEKPDIIALQEVNQRENSPYLSQNDLRDSNFVPAGSDIREDNWAFCLTLLARGYHWSWIHTHLAYGKWEEGVAVLSLAPIAETRFFDLSPKGVHLRRRVLAIRNKYGWFCSAHLGWWNDTRDPFSGQWEKLQVFTDSLSRPCYLMGDFNSPVQLQNEGYEMIVRSGWQDCYTRAEEKDSGITVPGQIDGWRDKEVDGFRMDLCLAAQNGRTRRSKVMFNGSFYPAVSDHFGVLTEESFDPQ